MHILCSGHITEFASKSPQLFSIRLQHSPDGTWNMRIVSIGRSYLLLGYSYQLLFSRSSFDSFNVTVTASTPAATMGSGTVVSSSNLTYSPACYISGRNITTSETNNTCESVASQFSITTADVLLNNPILSTLNCTAGFGAGLSLCLPQVIYAGIIYMLLHFTIHLVRHVLCTPFKPIKPAKMLQTPLMRKVSTAITM